MYMKGIACPITNGGHNYKIKNKSGTNLSTKYGPQGKGNPTMNQGSKEKSELRKFSYYQ